MSDATNPLVSIIVRTVGRRELEQALASIDAQSYPDIETLVVDASGNGLPNTALAAKQTLLSVQKPLNRSAAANLGLESVAGEFVLFLDDDDWIGPTHIETLVAELRAKPTLIAVYSSTQKTKKNGEPLEEFFAEKFDLAILRRDNFMPIHSVLFRRTAIDQGCRFDTNLAIYEDWDFWLQVAELGEIQHIDVISAFYRGGGDSETPVKATSEKYAATHPNAQARARVIEKWARRWTGAELNETFGSLDNSDEIESLTRNYRNAQKDFAEQLDLHEKAREALMSDYEQTLANERRLRTELQESCGRAMREHQEIRAQLSHLLQQNGELSQQIEQILNSFSWRITKPYRFISRWVKKKLASPAQQKNSAVYATISADGSTGNQTIYASLDFPGEETHYIEDDLSIEGWAFSSSSPIRISVSINGRSFTLFQPSLNRSDVADAFPSSPSARISGFKKRIDTRFLPSGKLTIEVGFHDDTGSITTTRELANLSPKEVYSLWLQQQEKDYKQVKKNPVASSSDIAVVLLATSSQDDLDSLAEKVGQQIDCSPQIFSADFSDDPVKTAGNFFAALRKAAQTCKSLTVISADQILRDHALASLSAELNSSDANLVYSDHDQVDDHGNYHSPQFTFGWSPEHLLARNYIGEIYLFSSALFQQLDQAFEESIFSVLRESPSALSSIRYRLLLELGKHSRRVTRVADILWSDARPSQLDQTSELIWVQDFVSRENPNNRIVELPHDSTSESVAAIPQTTLRVADRQIIGTPLVSIIIPTMAKMSLIKPCIESLKKKTSYPNYEIVILDNSRGKFPDGIAYLQSQGVNIISCDFDFNWPRLNNIGVREAKGDYLLFLNDDVEVIEEQWLDELLKQAQRDEVGAVGALLYYAEMKIQHAGIVLVNYGGGGIHLFHKLSPAATLFNRLHEIPREVSANTGACLMVSREKFDAVGGFDESLVVVGNDVDLCLKLRKSGLVNIWTPRCRLIHYESISRKTNAPRDDEERMWQRWGEWFERGDEYYNPHLTLRGVDCAKDLPLSEGIIQQALANMPTAQNFGAQSASENGVNLIGYIRAEMGLGEGARSDARALSAAGVAFGIINFEQANPARMGDLSWQHKERFDAPFDVTLWHINADHLSGAMQAIPHHLTDQSYQIAYWAWELEVMPENWRSAIELVDEIWVPSEFVQQAIQAETEKPVSCLPHCVAPKPDASMNRRYFGLPMDRFLFLAMYDTHSISDRKNPKAALEAFISAFTEEQSEATLVLKVNNPTSDSMVKLRSIIGKREDIHILQGSLSKTEIDSLIAATDCYVSLHRSEGFGLAPAEAMALAKPVILTNWSGSLEYTDAEHCLPISYELVDLEQDYGPYKKGQRWADPSLAESSAAMKKLVANREFASDLGEKAQTFIQRNFSPEAIGQRMKARLDAIRKGSD